MITNNDSNQQSKASIMKSISPPPSPSTFLCPYSYLNDSALRNSEFVLQKHLISNKL